MARAEVVWLATRTRRSFQPTLSLARRWPIHQRCGARWDVHVNASASSHLGSRANAYIGYVLQRYVFGVRDAQSPALAPGEPGWFSVYAIAAFINRALALPHDDTDHFADDVASPFQVDINALAAAGLTYGCGDGRFCPNDVVSRSQAASFVARAMGVVAMRSPPEEVAEGRPLLRFGPASVIAV